MGDSPSPASPEVPPDRPAPFGAADDTGADRDVPTFDEVRDRIEGRYATAMGTTELAQESEAGRAVAKQEEDRESAARDRLEQIRRSMRGES